MRRAWIGPPSEVDPFVAGTGVETVMIKVQWTTATPRPQLIDQLGRWAAVAQATRAGA